MEELSFDNILGENEIETLFMEPEDIPTEEPVGEIAEDNSIVDNSKEEKGKEKEKKTTEVVDPEALFAGEEPESVGSEEEEKIEDEGTGDSPTDDGGGTSPDNFYSSIANAVAEDGVFPNLDEETIKKATDAESFSQLFDLEVMARLDEVQQRIAKALDNGVEPNDIRKYENTLNYIASITDEAVVEESEKGEQLRRNLIYQDFLNKGYTPEKAQKFTERTISAGTDVEDAREALQSNREFFQNAYDSLLREAQQRVEIEKAERKKQAEQLRESLMKDKGLFGGIELSDDVRKKAYDNISKPVYRDPETGSYYTAIQKYEMEHRAEFLKYAGLFYTLTNGFKDFESFTKDKVKKEVKKGLRELEHKLNNTSRSTSGSLKMVTKASEDPESFITKGIMLDI